MYRSYRQNPERPFSFDTPRIALRVDGDPLAVVPFLRAAVRRVHPDAAVDDVMTMNTRISVSVAEPRFNAVVLGFFGVTALTLAAVGVYGVIAHAVSRRRREIGIRMALGALRHDVLGLVLRQSAWSVGVGTVAGLVGAGAVTQFLDSLLFGVATTDIATFLAAPALLLLVAALACYLPARRATRLDPAMVLRHE